MRFMGVQAALQPEGEGGQEQLWTSHEWGSRVLSTDFLVLTVVLSCYTCVLCVYFLSRF